MQFLERLGRMLDNRRRIVAMVLYGALVGIAYAGAWLLRFEFAVPQRYVLIFAWTALPVIAIRMVVFRVFRLARERWRYAGASEAGRLLAACATGSVVFVILDVLLPFERLIPLSVIGIEAMLSCGLISAAWLGYRLSFEHIRRQGAARPKRVVIIGAGDAGNLLAREMSRTPTGYVPVGFVDDNPRMWRASVQGVDVIGATADVATIAASCHADELIIALPSAPPEALRRIVGLCEATGLPYKVLPGIAEVVAGNVTLQHLREVRIEDLLGREPIRLELPELAADLRTATVLITGAAGSIGSELARQVALHRPQRLLLLDQAETDLFYLDLELRHRHGGLEIVPIVGDITDLPGMERVFRCFRPDRVYHAAAYKHVPMMEANAREAIRNNVLGTWRVAEAAGRYGAGTFVLVSTDKAVNPSNVMGATKRLAELIILELQGRYPETSFGAVRFGNVLGSNGSVIPIFRRQLGEGRPLTVTHPDTTRYFMTIPEAVQLILQASLLEQFRGRIAMLEMGDPVRIRDLAANLLRLSGVARPEDHMVFTGLRPGEKLHEELSAPGEETQPTTVPKVRVLSTASPVAPALVEHVRDWDESLRNGCDEVLLSGFCELFPMLRHHVVELGAEAAVGAGPLVVRLRQ
jgi:FlaA1/EpsC-like NDP-sugar epimerase